MVFENTPLRQIIHILEDTYGLNIEIENAQKLERSYTGTFHHPDPKIIPVSLEALFDLKIKRKNDLIIIQ